MGEVDNVEDDGEYDLEDSTLDAVEKEWEEAEQRIQNAQIDDVDEDNAVYSDDVQRAFESYENEVDEHLDHCSLQFLSNFLSFRIFDNGNRLIRYI